jgi:hypothetical protein
MNPCEDFEPDQSSLSPNFAVLLMFETQEAMDAHRGQKRRRLSAESSQMLVCHSQNDQILSESEPVEGEVVEERNLQKPTNVLRSDKVSESRAAIAKTGVVYLSRIPPRLSPTKIRQLLTPFGSSILRIFLAPESTAEHSRRAKAGGSKRRQFTEGWVEFEDKKVAKKVAGLLNAQRIGTKKGDFWYDDLWCIKYLPKFKWHHLTEQTGTTLKIFFFFLSPLVFR